VHIDLRWGGCLMDPDRNNKTGFDKMREKFATLKVKNPKVNEYLKTYFLVLGLILAVLLVLRFTMDETYEKAYTLAQENCRQQGYVDIKDFEKNPSGNGYIYRCEMMKGNFHQENGSWVVNTYEENIT